MAALTALTTALTALLVLPLLARAALTLALAALTRLALTTLALLAALLSTLLSLLAALSLLAGTIHFISHRKSPVSCIVGSPQGKNLRAQDWFPDKEQMREGFSCNFIARHGANRLQNR